MPHPHAHHEIDVWSVEGRFEHPIYSPRGAIEGFLLVTDDIPTQFVLDAKDPATAERIARLRPGQSVVAEGTEAGPSPKGEPVHTVYHLERLRAVDGEDTAPDEAEGHVRGTIARFNFARHGEPNGYVLDTGDFVHTRPDGFALLDLSVGDAVEASGRIAALMHGKGRVVEAREVNGQPIGPDR